MTPNVGNCVIDETLGDMKKNLTTLGELNPELTIFLTCWAKFRQLLGKFNTCLLPMHNVEHL